MRFWRSLLACNDFGAYRRVRLSFGAHGRVSNEFIGPSSSVGVAVSEPLHLAVRSVAGEQRKCRNSKVPFPLWAAPFALAVVLTGACHASDVSSHAIPGTSITIEEALFLPGQTSKIPLATDVAWHICGPEDIIGTSNAGYVGTIVGKTMFQLARDRPCTVEIVEAVPKLRKPTSRVVEGPGCTWSFDLSAGAVRHVQLAIRPRAPAQLYRCLSRLGLFIIGIQGGLQIPDEKLFVPSSQSIWAAFPRVPAEVTMLQYILWRCKVNARSINDSSQISQLPRCK